MKKIPGLYVTLQKDGIIKRTLVTNKGETVLDETTIGAELIWYVELDYRAYIDSLIKIEDLAEKTEDDDDPENYGTVYLDTFDELLTEANELVYDIEATHPILGSLLRFDLLDHTKEDDGTPMYVYLTKLAQNMPFANRLPSRYAFIFYCERFWKTCRLVFIWILKINMLTLLKAHLHKAILLLIHLRWNIVFAPQKVIINSS